MRRSAGTAWNAGLPAGTKTGAVRGRGHFFRQIQSKQIGAGEPPCPNRPALRAGNRNSLARLRRTAASSDWSLPSCERGVGAPLSHFPPSHAGSEQSSLPSVLTRSGIRQRPWSAAGRGNAGLQTGTAPRSGAKPRSADPACGARRWRGPARRRERGEEYAVPLSLTARVGGGASLPWGQRSPACGGLCRSEDRRSNW